ncbi:MAG TPA: hypothetical protein PKL44_00290 [Candidatus Dojkabacteria bacterium]|nr:hypothetical protein [Candidatus Dojkabacteria bacterium]
MSSRNRRVTSPREITDPKEILLTIIDLGGSCTYCSCKVCEKMFKYKGHKICMGYDITAEDKVRLAKQFLKENVFLFVNDEEQIVLNQNS